MRVDQFDFHLPEELIAQRPLAQRSSSRLLCLNPVDQQVQHRRFTDLPGLLQAGDLLVFNNTKVLPARLFGQKETGGQVEILLERVLGPQRCLAQVRASKTPKAGSLIQLQAEASLRVAGREGSFFLLDVASGGSLADILTQQGHMPLPPYMTRDDDADDRTRYQTVYAEKEGAVAAPTAGLHFDDALLAQLSEQGIEFGYVTLHVGAGTFQPVRVDDVQHHEMHAEWLEVNDALVKQVKATRERGGRVIAVGTTAVRSLETAAQSGQLQPFSGDTRIFIYPGFNFQVVDALITNFHLPKSTLLMLVSAFAGRTFMLDAYAEAVAERYRFFSYGDAMLIEQRVQAEATP